MLATVVHAANGAHESGAESIVEASRGAASLDAASEDDASVAPSPTLAPSGHASASTTKAPKSCVHAIAALAQQASAQQASKKSLPVRMPTPSTWSARFMLEIRSLGVSSARSKSTAVTRYRMRTNRLIAWFALSQATPLSIRGNGRRMFRSIALPSPLGAHGIASAMTSSRLRKKPA